MIKLYNLALLALLAFGAVSLSLFACDDPSLPPVDVDAAIVLPEPVALEIFAPRIADALETVHPSDCVPEVRHLSYEEFAYATGACGSGACNAACSACLTSVSEGDVLTTVSADADTLAALVLHHVIDCEGGEWSAGEWNVMREVLAR